MLFYIMASIVIFLATFLPGLPVLTAAIPVLTVSIVVIVLGIPVTSLVRTAPKARGIIFVVIHLTTSVALLGGAVSAVSLYGQLSLLPSFGAVPVGSSVELLDALATLLVTAICVWTAVDGLRAGVRVLSTPRRLRLRRAYGSHVASRALVSRRSPSRQQVCELQDSLKASQEEVAALKAERDAAVAERDEASTLALEQLHVTVARLESELEVARTEAAAAVVTVRELRDAPCRPVSEKDTIIAQKNAAVVGQKVAVAVLNAVVLREKVEEVEQRASTATPASQATTSITPKATTSKRGTTPSGIDAPSGRKSAKENILPASAVTRAKTAPTKESSTLPPPFIMSPAR